MHAVAICYVTLDGKLTTVVPSLVVVFSGHTTASIAPCACEEACGQEAKSTGAFVVVQVSATMLLSKIRYVCTSRYGGRLAGNGIPVDTRTGKVLACLMVFASWSYF